MLQKVRNMKIRDIKNHYIMYTCLFLKYFISINILNLILLILGVIAIFFNFGRTNPAIIRLFISTILPIIFIIYLLSKNILKRDKPMTYFCIFLIIYQLLYEPLTNTYFLYDVKKSTLDNFIYSIKKTYLEPFEEYEYMI